MDATKKVNKRKVNREWRKDEIKALIQEYEARPDLWIRRDQTMQIGEK